MARRYSAISRSPPPAPFSTMQDRATDANNLQWSSCECAVHGAVGEERLQGLPVKRASRTRTIPTNRTGGRLERFPEQTPKGVPGLEFTFLNCLRGCIKVLGVVRARMSSFHFYYLARLKSIPQCQPFAYYFVGLTLYNLFY